MISVSKSINEAKIHPSIPQTNVFFAAIIFQGDVKSPLRVKGAAKRGELEPPTRCPHPARIVAVQENSETVTSLLLAPGTWGGDPVQPPKTSNIQRLKFAKSTIERTPLYSGVHINGGP